MPCGFSFVRRALRLLRKARLWWRVRQGNNAHLALCTQSHLSISISQSSTKASMLVQLWCICVVRYVDSARLCGLQLSAPLAVRLDRFEAAKREVVHVFWEMSRPDVSPVALLRQR
jgi:hypothetical protein